MRGALKRSNTDSIATASGGGGGHVAEPRGSAEDGEAEEAEDEEVGLETIRRERGDLNTLGDLIGNIASQLSNRDVKDQGD